METGSVLIVDDDLKLRRVLHAALSKVGFAVTGVANGESALQQATTSPFDAVVLDVNMPGIGGIEACRYFVVRHRESALHGQLRRCSR